VSQIKPGFSDDVDWLCYVLNILCKLWCQ